MTRSLRSLLVLAMPLSVCLGLIGCGGDDSAATKNVTPLNLTKEQAAAIEANDKKIEEEEHQPEKKAAKAK